MAPATLTIRPRPTNFREITLDEAIAEATSLGKVDMDQTFNLRWRVSLMFTNPRGSMIFARGEDAALIIAVGKAIDEARELGAGVAP